MKSPMNLELNEEYRSARRRADAAFPCTYRGDLLRIEQRKSCGGRTTPEGVFACNSPEKHGAEVSAERYSNDQRKGDLCRFCTIYTLPAGTTDAGVGTLGRNKSRSRISNAGFTGSREDLRNERIAAMELTPATDPSPEEKRRYTDSRGVTWTLPALEPEAFRALAVEIDSHIMPRFNAKGWIPEESVWKLRSYLLVRRLVRAEGEARGLTEKDWAAGMGHAKGSKGKATPAATIRAFEALRYVGSNDGAQELDCPTLRCEERRRFLANGGRGGPIPRKQRRPAQTTT